jgi:hypothetical protein
MPLGKSRLRLKPLTTQCTPHAVVTDARRELAWLDKVTHHRYTCLIASLVACPVACPYGVSVAKDAW